MKVVVGEDVSSPGSAVESGMTAARAVTEVAEVCAAEAHATGRKKR